MFFTAGFSAKLSNLVLQLSEQQKSFGSYLTQYPFLHRVFYERSRGRELFPFGFIMSACFSAAPTGRISTNLLFVTSIKNCREDQELLTFEQKDLPPCMRTQVRFIVALRHKFAEKRCEALILLTVTCT